MSMGGDRAMDGESRQCFQTRGFSVISYSNSSLTKQNKGFLRSSGVPYLQICFGSVANISFSLLQSVQTCPCLSQQKDSLVKPPLPFTEGRVYSSFVNMKSISLGNVHKMNDPQQRCIARRSLNLFSEEHTVT